jgi:hypothetical protein
MDDPAIDRAHFIAKSFGSMIAQQNGFGLPLADCWAKCQIAQAQKPRLFISI